MASEFASFLVGTELASVTFIRDYVQFSFDGPSISAITWPEVKVNDQTYVFADNSYCNMLRAQISKRVTDFVVVKDVSLAICFDDGSEIRISLLPEDKTAPEAAIGHYDTHIWVW